MRGARYWRRHKYKLALFIVVMLGVVLTQSGWLAKLPGRDVGEHAIRLSITTAVTALTL